MPPFTGRADDLREVATARGQFRMWKITRGVYASEVVGHMEDEHTDLFLEFSEARVRERTEKLVVFHDWMEMTGYDSSCRTRITGWTLGKLDCYASVHVALKSKLVAMGVQVANLALGGLVKTYPSRVQLQAALRSCLAGSRSVPPQVR